ncbi:MAG: hydrolase [Afipia sp. 64-13]|nr:MAG: hydrolase [Afipia sp. 64-13]
MIATKKILLIACVMLFAAGVGLVSVQSVSAQTMAKSDPQESAIPVGESEFRLVVKRGPVKIFTYRPKSFTADSPIWIVIHGARRNVAGHGSSSYYDVWQPLAERAGALLLLPEFTKQVWPTSWQFQFGNVRTPSLDPIPWKDTGFAVAEMAFRKAVAMTGSHRQRFFLYGHGGGAQWVQRYILQSGDRYVERAIAANPGWYLIPDDEFTYPYGLKGADIPQATLRQAFKTEFTLLLGQKDRRTTGIIRENRQTRAQGANRYERGHFYFRRAASIARRMGAPFAWRIHEVPGAGHDNAEMAPTAAELFMESR